MDSSTFSDCNSPLLFDTPFERPSALDSRLNQTVDLTLDGDPYPTPIPGGKAQNSIEISSSPSDSPQASDCCKQLNLSDCDELLTPSKVIEDPEKDHCDGLSCEKSENEILISSSPEDLENSRNLLDVQDDHDPEELPSPTRESSPHQSEDETHPLPTPENMQSDPDEQLPSPDQDPDGSYSHADVWDGFEDMGIPDINMSIGEFTEPQAENTKVCHNISLSQSEKSECCAENEHDEESDPGNVWDEFDDCGQVDVGEFFNGDEEQFVSQLPSTSIVAEAKSARSPSKTERDLPDVEDFDPPTDMESDISLALNKADDSILWKSDNEPCMEAPMNVATPSPKPKPVKRNKRKWMPPSPFTPMPKYSDMVTPELKKACQKYGVRALPKKKMKALLEDIYKKTHRYETDSEYDGTPVPKSKTSTSSITQNERPAQSKPAKTAKLSRAGQKTVTTKAKSTAAAKPKTTKATKLDLDFSSSDDDADTSSCSQQSDIAPLLEESMLVSDDKESKLSKRDAAYKKKQIWEYIKSRNDLYEQILHYETLDFTAFHQGLKTAGLNIGAAVVMDFLDEQNVQFTMKNQSTRQRKPQKKTKSKKVSSSQN